MTTETVPDAGRPAEESDASMDELAVTTIRTLAMDAVQAANSGHPGTPMALAPVAYTLWQRLPALRPRRPDLAQPRPLRALDRPRLDAALLAAPPDRREGGQPGLRAARRAVGPARRHQALPPARLRCPGHPEYRWTSGVETTTGPLGQGVATSVGMAIAGHWLAAHFNRPGFELFDYDVYALCGDGDMMEGISVRGRLARRPPQAREPLLDLRQQPDHDRGQHRASRSPRTSPRASSATAGTSPASATPTTCEMLARAFETFKNERDRPTLIIVDSHIGYGAPTKQDTQRRPRRAARRGGDRGSPSGPTAGPRTRSSSSPTACASTSRPASASAARELREAWMERFERVPGGAPRPGRPARCGCSGASCPTAGTRDIPEFPPDAKGLAGRDASGKVLNAIAKNVPWLHRRLGRPRAVDQDAPDLRGRGRLQPRRPARPQPPLRHPRARDGRGASTGWRCRRCAPFGSGFLIFSDYGRAPIRLGALMEIPAIHVFTHDSIGVGEDGPTHQPIEQLAVAARDARPDHDPAGRRQRGRRGVAADHGAQARPGRARPLAPGRCRRSTARATRRPPGVRQRRLRARRPAGRRRPR